MEDVQARVDALLKEIADLQEDVQVLSLILQCTQHLNQRLDELEGALLDHEGRLWPPAQA